MCVMCTYDICLYKNTSILIYNTSIYVWIHGYSDIDTEWIIIYTYTSNQ